MNTPRSVAALAAALVLLAAGAAAFAQEDPKKEAEAWVQLAAPAVRHGDWETAQPQLEKALKADPGNVDAALLLARIAEKTGDLAKALAVVGALPPDARILTRKA